MTDVMPPGGPGAADVPGAAAGGPGAGEDAGLTDAGLAAERERLARQLRDTRMQLAMTEARLTALQQSATMRLGKTFVNAAKRPWPRGAQLPRDLYRMWRDRGAPATSGGATLAATLAAAQLNDLKGTGGRFLSVLTAPGALSLADPALLASGVAAGAEPARLVVTGALTQLACATLAPDAVVHPLLPHDADLVIEATGADLVIIEAAALLPGSPWAYATDPAGADRGRRLARLIVMARSLGKPVLLVRNAPPAALPGLGWVASSCDAVFDGGFGVQLARFNPVGVSAARPTGPLFVQAQLAGAGDQREAPAVRALLDRLTGGPGGGAGAPVTLAGPRSWRGLPALYRGNAVFVTASADQAREQVACGARVIGPIGAGSGAESGPDGLLARIEAARSAAPRGAAGTRLELREIFAEHATPARLAALARTAGLPPALAGGREIAVLAALDGTPGAAGALAAALLGQRLRPAEVVVSVPAAAGAPGTREALSVLSGHGITVRVTTAPAPAALAALADSPWAVPWPSAADRAPSEWHLLDLACARECAQADAVGFGAGEYEFARWLDTPALARRELLLAGAPEPGEWGARGLRLFTVARARG